jgi:DNA-binding IclR family transcriptional regulator
MTVPAARQTLQLLRYLAEHGGPVRAATISRDLSLARSTTYHLLRVLQDEGFLLHSPESQAYALSPLLGELGSSVATSEALARLAQPVLERLVGETTIPVVAHLALFSHGDVVYASKVAGSRAPAVVTSIGVRLPAHLTATGRAILAALSKPQVDAIYTDASALVTRTGPGPTTRAALHALLDETRVRGWATELGDITLDYASVAAAVIDHNGHPAAAVGLTFRVGAADDRQLALLGRGVRSAADALSRRVRGKL